MKNFLKHSLKTGAIVLIAAAAVAGIVSAGSLTPPATPNATSYTLDDIYTRLTTNATASAGNHSLSTTTSPAASFHTLTEIYGAIPTIDATKVLTGTTYLGVAGTAEVGATNLVGFLVYNMGFMDGYVFKQNGTLNGKPRYNTIASSLSVFDTEHIISWSGTQWEISDVGGDGIGYTSTENVATPDLVQVWADVPGLDYGRAPIFLKVYSN